MFHWKVHERLRFMAILAELSRKKRRQEKLKIELTCALHTAEATCLQFVRLIDLIDQYQQIVCCISCCNFWPQPEFVKCGWCQRLLCFDHFWGAVDEFGHFCAELG